MNKRFLFSAMVVIAGTLSILAQAAPQPQFVPGQVLIQLKAGADAASIGDALNRGAVALQRKLATVDNQQLFVAQTRNVQGTIQALQNHPAVDLVEPNWIYTHSATADDPFFVNGSLWGMYGPTTLPKNTYGSQADAAWANGNTGSEQVYVGIIDEGVQWFHEDLAANGWTNPGESGLYAGVDLGTGLPIMIDAATDGIDNDGNGYVDDVHGWDFYHRDATVFDGGDADGCGDAHGTHVTGTICGAGNNGIGVAGITWNVKFISGKFLGPNGGSTDAAVEAINYMVGLKNKGANIVALNNSWGGGGYSAALHTAIKKAAMANILFIAAAGNSGFNNDIFASYPANYDTTKTTDGTASAGYDSVIAVAAIDSAGNKPSWSNYGKTSVDLGAPGVDIGSTVPGGYASYSGTSMATPHVTGAVALYFSNPSRSTASPSTARQAILDAAKNTYTKSMNRRTVTNGRLNVSGF